MAAAVHCWALPSKLSALSLNSPSSSSAHLKPTAAFTSLSLSATISHRNVFSSGFLVVSPVMRPNRLSIVCQAASTKKPDQAEKRARQNEKRRLRNKSRKSEVRTRMKKVLKALELLRRKKDAEPTEVLAIENLIAEAFSSIDKAVRKGVLHRNTGKRRKSRLARRKTAVEIYKGWYTPAPAATV